MATSWGPLQLPTNDSISHDQPSLLFPGSPTCEAGPPLLSEGPVSGSSAIFFSNRMWKDLADLISVWFVLFVFRQGSFI